MRSIHGIPASSRQEVTSHPPSTWFIFGFPFWQRSTFRSDLFIATFSGGTHLRIESRWLDIMLSPGHQQIPRMLSDFSVTSHLSIPSLLGLQKGASIPNKISSYIHDIKSHSPRSIDGKQLYTLWMLLSFFQPFVHLTSSVHWRSKSMLSPQHSHG